MIWYKTWLETRFGVAFIFVLFTLVFLVAGAGVRIGAGSVPADKAPKPEELQVAVDALSFSWIAAAVSLAGTGIKTPSGGLQNTKGIHGSTLYTLSLPVSRLRLIAVRTVVGLLETVVVIVVFTQLAWWVFPKTGQNTVGEIVAHFVVTVICASTFYFLSLFLGTFLDDALRLPGAMTVLALLFTLDVTRILPPYLNIFRPMGSGSPLNTHTIAWGTLGISLAASAILFAAAVKVVRTQEY
jgi:hypothetical protein